MEKVPVEIWNEIFSYLGNLEDISAHCLPYLQKNKNKNLLQISLVCKLWRRIVKETPKLLNQLCYVINGPNQMKEFIDSMNEISMELRLNPKKIRFIKLEDQSIENFMSHLKFDSLIAIYVDQCKQISTENSVQLIEMSKSTLKTFGIFYHQCSLDQSLLFKALESIEILHWGWNKSHLKSITRMRNLKELYLNDNETLDVSNSKLESFIALRSNDCLLDKNFASNLIHLVIDDLISNQRFIPFICHNCIKLQSLKITNVRMDGSEFIPDTLDHLKELKLELARFVKNATLKNIKFQNLQSLDMGYYLKTEELMDIHLLGENNPNLEHVYLHDIGLQSDQIFEKTFYNMKNLKSISFHIWAYFKVTPNAIINLAINCRKLKRIEIRDYRKNNQHFSQLIIEELKFKKPNLAIIIH